MAAHFSRVFSGFSRLEQDERISRTAIRIPLFRPYSVHSHCRSKGRSKFSSRQHYSIDNIRIIIVSLNHATGKRFCFIECKWPLLHELF